jgi:hypothetical protein
MPKPRETQLDFECMPNRHNRPMSAHFHSGGLDFAYFGEDLGKPVGEPVKAIAPVAVWKGASEQLQRMLGSLEGIDETVEARLELWRRGFGLWSQMSGFGASHLELTLEIGKGDIDIAHGHLRIDVAE